MTYRNKLLLKRSAVILGILLLIIAIVLLAGFYYMGRFVVYTEDGAYFGFNSDAHTDTVEGLDILPPEDPVLVTGASLHESEVLGNDDVVRLAADEVNGLLVDYATLKDGSTLNAIELAENEYNMLILEMRSEGGEILDTEPVRTLLERAKKQNMRLAAMISCLDDSEYALDHTQYAFRIDGGALWMNSDGNYYLDPGAEEIQDYIYNMVLELLEMGFHEIILNHFEYPASSSIVYEDDEATRTEKLIDAYESLEERIGINGTLGLLITDPDTGHQAFDYAEHLYVFYHVGNYLQTYIENHPDYYVVFVSDSHDTRFDQYGKVMVENSDAAFIPEEKSETE